MIRRPPRSTQSRSSAASDVYKRQAQLLHHERAVAGHPADQYRDVTALGIDGDGVRPALLPAFIAFPVRPERIARCLHPVLAIRRKPDWDECLGTRTPRAWACQVTRAWRG